MDQVVTGAEIVSTIGSEWPIEPTDANYIGEVAKRYRYVDGQGEIGVITSVSQPFCGDCSRARLSAEGPVYTCLFASGGTDLRSAIRSGSDSSELKSLIGSIWSGRTDQYSQTRSQHTAGWQKVEMSFIGG